VAWFVFRTLSESQTSRRVRDGAGNGNIVANTYTIQAGSPASAFEKHEEEILEVVTAETLRSVRATVSRNVRMTMAADTTNDCGAGAEIGIVSRSSDGLSNLSVNIRSDRVGDTTRTGLGLQFDRFF
jgi:hypothetical protein